MKLKNIFTLNAGEYFGEIALMQKEALRTCSVIVASDNTSLMEINKTAFDAFVGEYKTESVITIINFYKNCKLLTLMPDQRKVELSAKSFLIKYPSNTVIIRQGEVPYNIYFVASGGVRQVRRLKSKLDIQTEDQDGKLYQIGRLGEGDSFGDYELFNKRNVMDTIITTMPTVVIYVPYFWLVERLSPTDLLKVKNMTKKKIEDKVAINAFKENNSWTKYKKDLLQHMIYEKESDFIKRGKISQYSTGKVDMHTKTKNIIDMVKAPRTITTRNMKTNLATLPSIYKSGVRLTKKY